MEQRLNAVHSGYALITVLIVTAIGLLFGAGALLLFRYQCQRRIDRQHELEKIYAVRSAVNYAKIGFISKTTEFKFQTWSDRELGLKVEPVKQIFPDAANPTHLVIGSAGDKDSARAFRAYGSGGQYVSEPDYEYGAVSNDVVFTVGESQMCSRNGELVFPDCTATNGVKWWVNIGLTDTRGWLQEDYGIRYVITPANYGPGDKDYIRLCIIKNTNHVEKIDVGCRHGWPLSRGERALVLEVGGGRMTLYEYGYGMARIPRDSLNCENTTVNMGVQIAGRRIYMFYTPNETAGLGYVLSDGWEMPMEENGIFDYFSNAMRPDASGREVLGTLRAVIECEACSDKRPYAKTGAEDRTGEIRISAFRVFPAYQYDVYLKCPEAAEELATVVQKLGRHVKTLDNNPNSPQYNLGFSMRTYDTHGTAWKGYKKGIDRR